MHVHGSIASIVLACSFLSCPASPAQCPSHARTSSRRAAPPEGLIASGLTIEGVRDFVEVTPHFYRGAQPTKKGFENLHAMGVDIVVDLRGNRKSERNLVRGLGMEYVPMPWHCPFPRDATFARFLRLMRAYANRKVFVHCRLGDDRVGMMVAAYRMAEQSWTAEQAMREMKASGFTSIHHLFCPGLASYEREFPERFRTSPEFKSLRESGSTERRCED